jgi:hypothetical protein
MTSKGRAIKRNICIDAVTDAKVKEFLANNMTSRGRLSQSALYRKAIHRYLKQEDEYWSLLFTCFNKLEDKVDGYTRGMELLKNVLMHFISYYFLNWPDYSPEEKEDASQKGMRIAAKFENSLKTKLEQGGYLQELTPDAIRQLIIDNQKVLNLDQVHEIASQDSSHKQQLHSTKSRENSSKQTR